MGIAVKLQAFEGPLDLLLHLIEKNKVSIYDIPIAEITDQYMAYLHEMKKQDLGVMSEFLLMAATLLNIKSRMLLPKEVNEEGEEEDPRQELVQQLLEYKMYKYISYELKERRQDAAQVLYHKQDLPEEVKAYKQPVSTEELLAGVTLSRMHRIFVDIIKYKSIAQILNVLADGDPDRDLRFPGAEMVCGTFDRIYRFHADPYYHGNPRCAKTDRLPESTYAGLRKAV